MDKKKVQELGKKYGKTALTAGVLLGSTLAGAQDTSGATTPIDPKPIADAAKSTIGVVLGAGAAVMGVSVGGRVAVKWVKRLVGMA